MFTRQNFFYCKFTWQKSRVVLKTDNLVFQQLAWWEKKPLSSITLPQCLLLLLRVLLLLLQYYCYNYHYHNFSLLLLLLLTPNILYVGVDTPLTQSLFTYLSLALVYSSILLYRGQKLRVYVTNRSLHFEILLFG